MNTLNNGPILSPHTKDVVQPVFTDVLYWMFHTIIHSHWSVVLSHWLVSVVPVGKSSNLHPGS